jgi:hypothetical protein
MKGFTFWRIVPMMQEMSGSSALMTVRALRSADLSRAQSAFLVANSPLFLLRKLRDDPAVVMIAKYAVPTAILKQLRQSLSRPPRALHTAVAPYVYLVALSMQPDIRYLHEASELSAPHHAWFRYLSGVLLQTYKPTTVQMVTLPSKEAERGSINASSNNYTLLLEH